MLDFRRALGYSDFSEYEIMRRMVKSGCTMMGTLVTIVVEHTDVAEGKRAINKAFDEMRRIEELMSLYKENSDVSILNSNGVCEHADADTIEVVKGTSYGYEVSDGGWDITALPLLKLWEDRAHRGKVPTDAEITKALELVDYSNIVIESDRIRFKKSGMGITLAGVAKGYAIDKAITTLSQCGIEHALVNAGGDIRSIGGKTDTRPWRIAIRNPHSRRKFAATVELRDQAIATSGTYHRYFSDIIDIKTGKPAREIVSSTIVAEKAIEADSLSTTVFILGVERGLKLVAELGIAALVITRQGEVWKSSYWHQES